MTKEQLEQLAQIQDLPALVGRFNAQRAANPNVQFDVAGFLAWMATDLPQVIASLAKLYVIITT